MVGFNSPEQQPTKETDHHAYYAQLRHRSTKSLPDELYALFSLMAQQRVGCRAGRVEPRAVKRRPKPYPLLTKPRDQARAEIGDR